MYNIADCFAWHGNAQISCSQKKHTVINISEEHHIQRFNAQENQAVLVEGVEESLCFLCNKHHTSTFTVYVQLWIDKINVFFQEDHKRSFCIRFARCHHFNSLLMQLRIALYFGSWDLKQKVCGMKYLPMGEGKVTYSKSSTFPHFQCYIKINCNYK